MLWKFAQEHLEMRKKSKKKKGKKKWCVCGNGDCAVIVNNTSYVMIVHHDREKDSGCNKDTMRCDEKK